MTKEQRQFMDEIIKVGAYRIYYGYKENIGRKNIGKWQSIRQIRQYFPPPYNCAIRYSLLLQLSMKSLQTDLLLHINSKCKTSTQHKAFHQIMLLLLMWYLSVEVYYFDCRLLIRESIINYCKLLPINIEC